MLHSRLLLAVAFFAVFQHLGATPLSCQANPSQFHCARSDAGTEDMASDMAILLQQSVRAEEFRDAFGTIDVSPHEKFPVDAAQNVSHFSGTTFAPHRHFDTVMKWLASSLQWTYNRNPVKEEGLDRWEYADTITIAMVLILLVCFDGLVAPKIPSTMPNHLLVLGFMILLSALFCGGVYVQRGESDALAWATGYVVEIALSMDNLFVFHLVFQKFRVVENNRVMYALSFGIYGALALRIIFIAALTKLLEVNFIVDIIVGAVLVMSGILTLYDDDDDQDVEDLYTVKFFRWVFGDRLKEEDKTSAKSGKVNGIGDAGECLAQCQLFAKDESGRTQITLLCLVVCVISVVDVFFAVDSVGSKTGQIKNIFINLSSSLLAMFSLRALYFIVKDLNDYFAYVKYGICAILCFVGIEMMISKWYAVPLGLMCAIIAGLFTLSVVASILKVRSEGADITCADKEIAS